MLVVLVPLRCISLGTIHTEGMETTEQEQAEQDFSCAQLEAWNMDGVGDTFSAPQ